MSSLDRLLDAAGLRRDKRQDQARIVDLLQARPAAELPPRLAQAILDAHGIVEPKAASRLADAIVAIGDHGIEPRDEAARGQMHRHIADATRAAIELVDELDER